ncbi:MAG: histidine phosphatase family protein [Acidobacteriota bacterium]|nr:histidine phosphatase family protein [Acidobacteriota bacterium]
MRSLWILRHAKAVAHASADHGRELSGRGLRQCEELASHLRALPDAPDEVLCSSATRALETARSAVAALPEGVALTVEAALYGADADDVVGRLRLVDDDRAAVMVVGHNPTLLELLLLLLDPGDTAGSRRLADGLPTCALAVVDLDVAAWDRLAAGTGRLRSFFVAAAR